MIYVLPQIASNELLQKQLNAIFADIQGSQPGYGAVLPDIADTLDGRLFNQTGVGLFQAISGAWVAV